MTWRVVFFSLLAALIVTVVGYRYHQYMLVKNFTLEAYTSCDPDLQNCFTLTDPSMDLGFQDGPYEKVELTARFAPACLEEHACSNFVCDPADSACNITYCSPDTLGDGEQCTSETTK